MEGPVQELTKQAVQHGPWLKDLLVFVAATALVVPLFHRVRIGAVAGFLLVGLAVGPHGLGKLASHYDAARLLTIEDEARVKPFAELGVIFLLFLIGLELSFARLWSLRKYVLGLGSVQFVGSAAVIGVVAIIVGAPTGAAAVLGVSLAMSSTAVVMELLEERGRSNSSLGRVAFSVLLFQDLMVAPILFAVELLGKQSGSVATEIALALLQAGVSIAMLVLLGRYAMRPLFRFAAATGSREFIMAMTILVVVLMAIATQSFGMSTALGAFLAGILVSETEYRHEVEAEIVPFKGLLLGLFFVTVGMSIDLSDLKAHWQAAVLAMVSLIAFKAAVSFSASRWFSLPHAVSAEASLLLAQAGEFGFVVLGLAAGSQLIESGLAQFAMSVIGLSMLLTPVGALIAEKAGRVLQNRIETGQLPPKQQARSGHVIIGGFGRVGQAVADILTAEQIDYLALDTNSGLVSEMTNNGKKIVFGDSGRPELLRLAGVKGAAAVIVTVNAQRAAERTVAAARRENPTVPIIARARDLRHALRLKKSAAVEVVPEMLETTLLLGGRLLDVLGLPEEIVEHRIQYARRELSAGPIGGEAQVKAL